MRHALIALSIVAASIAPTARTAQAAPSVFESRHYKITTDADAALARQIAAHMDAVYAEYSRRFSDFRAGAVAKYPLHVYARRDDYLSFLRSHGINGAGSGGMFFRTGAGFSALATFLEDQSDDRLYHTLRHEGFHQFAANKIGGDLPVWCNEGLAEYFGEAVMIRTGPKADQQNLRCGQVPVTKLATLQALVKAEEHLPFDKLIGMSHAEWGNRVKTGAAGMQYDQSWSIVHFLVSGDAKYQRPFINYLMLVSKGTASREAFARSFGASDTRAFENAWKKWLLAAEPNPEKTAAMRLAFIGRGVQFMREKGSEKPFATLAQIRAELQRVQFRTTIALGEDATLEIRAKDDENFQPPDSLNPKSPSALVETPNDNEAIPPDLAVTGLRLVVKLVWSTDSEGKLTHRVIYEEPAPARAAPVKNGTVKKKENGK